MADPDDKRAAKTFAAYPKVPKYKDFRRMFDKETKNIDAVLVSCPDHLHATAAMWAMARGKHVYCQKPLTRTVWEAQQLTAGAEKYGVATQMGNQGYSQVGARECCEIIWNGDIGNVTEVHAWTNRPDPYWPQGPGRGAEGGARAVHARLGCLAGRRRTAPLQPGLRAAQLARASRISAAARSATWPATSSARPTWRCGSARRTSVECIKMEGKSKYTFPYRVVIRFDFPARGSMPPVKLFWYDRMLAQPKIEGVPEGELLGDKDINGSLFIGDKGMVTTGCYGERTRLVPAER